MKVSRVVAALALLTVMAYTEDCTILATTSICPSSYSESSREQPDVRRRAAPPFQRSLGLPSGRFLKLGRPASPPDAFDRSAPPRGGVRIEGTAGRAPTPACRGVRASDSHRGAGPRSPPRECPR